MFEDLSPVILFRMGERLVLTGIVIVVAIVVLIGFWKTVQRLSIRDGGPLGIAGSVALSTPVLALLAIILYAWVSLSHPISFGAPTAATGSESLETADAGGPAAFTGAVNPQSRPVATEEVDSYARQRVRQQIWSLNCLAAQTEVRPAAEADLTEIKLALMRGVWSDDWGNLPRFEAWARNPAAGTEPAPAAREVFEGKHTGC